jgi:serine O-acetyltransferase
MGVGRQKELAAMRCEGYAFSHLRADLARDIDVYLRFAAEYHAARRNWRRSLSALCMPSLLACLLYRVSHWLYSCGWRRLAIAVARFNLLALRVSITPASRIGGGLYIPHPGTGIVFQGNAGRDLKLFAGCGASAAPFTPLHGGPMPDAPHFGDNVSLGAMSFVVGPVRVGSNVRIGFNAIIARDLPDNATIVSIQVRSRLGPGASEAVSAWPDR